MHDGAGEVPFKCGPGQRPAANPRGDVDEETTLVQKIMNDLGYSPERSIRSYSPSNAASFREVALGGIRSRRGSESLIQPTQKSFVIYRRMKLYLD